MKALKWFIVLAVTFIVVFASLSEINSQVVNRMKDRFYLGYFNSLVFDKINSSQNQHWNWFGELSLNQMHSYGGCYDWDSGKYDAYGNLIICDGGFFTPINYYSSYISTNIINRWYSHISSSHSLILAREKVLRGAYGQSSIYQAEKTDGSGNNWCGKYPGYGYTSHNDGNSQDDNDTWYQNNFGGELIRARHCNPNVSTNAGLVFSGLYENCEQASRVDSVKWDGSDVRLFSDYKNWNYRWFVKPRIRIDKDYAMAHPDDNVADVIIKAYDGQEYTTTLKCRNFINDITNQYNGCYMERFFQITGNPDSAIYIKSQELLNTAVADADGKTIGLENCVIDYKIYWYGLVDTWIDYVKVEDEWAHYLFTDLYGNNPNNIYQFGTRIQAEITAFAGSDGFGYFYSDEAFYNNIPCIAEVNKIVKQLSGNTTALIPDAAIDVYNYGGGLRNVPLREHTINYVYNSGAVNEIFISGGYPYRIDPYENAPVPPNIRFPDKPGLTGVWTYANSNDEYNDYMNNIERDMFGLKLNRLVSNFCKEKGIVHSWLMQVHSDEKASTDVWSWREPTPQEISMQAYLGLAFGARQILEFLYQSWHNESSDLNLCGMLGFDLLTKRRNTYFTYNNGNDTLRKWENVVALHQKIKYIGDFLYPPGQTQNFFIHNKIITVNDINNSEYRLPYSYLQNLISYYKYNGQGNWNDTTTLSKDETVKKYYEIGFFSNPSNSFEKYMLVLNKRCAPVINGVGDQRTVNFKFDKDALTYFNNWMLKDMLSGEQVTFDKNNISGGVYFQYPFQPGEGKLFRLAPVMVKGGNLVCNESFSGISFTNDSTVNGNGYDITIGGNTTISFKNIGNIVLNGGTFKCGTKLINGNVTLQGASWWNGLELNDCDTLTIQNTTIKDIPYLPSPDNLYGIKINNCENVTVKNNIFNNSTNAGFLNINFIDVANNTATYVINNYITGDYCVIGFYINSNGGQQNQVYIQDNIFNASDGGSGIFLNNISGGVITGNTINNCSFGINLWSSSVDVYGNTITNSIGYTKGINSVSESTANLSPSRSESGTEYVGGDNNISNTGTGDNNIYVNNSYFYLDLGNNIFTIEDENTNHLSGWFPEGDYCGEDEIIKARYNCFYLGSNINPKSDVKCGETGNLIIFDFYSQNPTCQTIHEQYDVITLAEDIYDSIPVKSGGSGGGIKPNKDGIATALLTANYYNRLKDTIIIGMRKRNYNLVISQCTQMLTLFPDSSFSIDALSKLYYSNLKLDSNGNKIGPLKSYYESLILSNPNNLSLIKRTNYFVQKCKVVLKQYASALQGFQEIINQNPYSYEGLVASWDYAAITLLMGSGSFNEQLKMNNEQLREKTENDLQFTIFDLHTMLDTLRNRKVNVNTYINDDFDKSKFTKKDREVIKTNVEKMYTSERTKQINRILELEKLSKSDNQTISEKSKSELKIMKTLGEIVKVKRPKTTFEHIKNVNNEVKKILGIEKGKENIKKSNLIPKEYSLSQNYPNPFNPVTKIDYELPKDSRVKLVIYDILGREIKTLVNELKHAGRYTVEFNGSNYASGVYFYRILVEDGKNYSSVKKMVLIK